LDAIATFNNDMKTLALNAYQLEDLLNLSLEENDVHLRWMKNMQSKNKNAFDQLKSIDKKFKSKIKWAKDE